MMIAVLALAIGVFAPAPCNLEGVPADFEKKNAIQCGWVAVPLRKDKPEGKSIRLWTARIRATGSDRRQDPVIYINGGPGIATVDAILPAIAESKSLTRLRQSRDILLFDQRGSGRSEESLCPELGKRLNAIETQGLDAVQEDSRTRAEFATCRAELDKAGLDVEAYTTSATVADMDSLRRAFGVEKWNLLSISYGSLVAMHAMRESPAAIRSVILNSPYPPNSVTWAEQASSAAAAYMAIDRECAAQPACGKRFGSVLAKLEATLSRLERTPLQDGKTLITGRRFAKALWPMAVRSSTVRFVPLAINKAYHGDEATIRKMVAKYASGDSFGDFSAAQNAAISCHESGRTAQWYARARVLYPTLVSAAPDDSSDGLCAAFRPGYADPAFFAPVASAIPTLIYAGSLDPATPTVDAYQAMRFLEHATLVEVPGAAHGPMGLDECTLGMAADFLDDPTAQPNLGCMAKRAAMEFATDGLDEVIAPTPSS
jgi:pimeloyl-ACP methyl ester carboxylesterase